MVMQCLQHIWHIIFHTIKLHSIILQLLFNLYNLQHTHLLSIQHNIHFSLVIFFHIQLSIPLNHLPNFFSSFEPKWCPDSGTSHHVTTYPNNLALPHTHNSSNKLMIGDGKSLSITHIGSKNMLCSSHS